MARAKKRYPYRPERVFNEVRSEVVKQRTRSEQSRRKRDAKRNELFRKVVTSRRIITVQLPPRSSSPSVKGANPDNTTMRGSASRVASPQTQPAKTISTPHQNTSAQAMAASPSHPAKEGDLPTLLEKLGMTDDLHSMTDAMDP